MGLVLSIATDGSMLCVVSAAFDSRLFLDIGVTIALRLGMLLSSLSAVAFRLVTMWVLLKGRIRALLALVSMCVYLLLCVVTDGL